MVFKKGNKINLGRKAWNKGIPRSEETKRKISEKNKGHIAWNKGKRMKDLIPNYISPRLGQISVFKGKTYEEIYGDKAEEQRQKRAFQRKNESNWKPNYRTLHAWINRHKPKPRLCEHCGRKPPYDLANKDHKYKRDVNDYLWLCRKCHEKYDYKKGLRGKNIGGRKCMKMKLKTKQN